MTRSHFKPVIDWGAWDLGVTLFDNRFQRVGLSLTLNHQHPLDWVLNVGWSNRKWKGKDKEMLWSPAVYEPQATRKKANVVKVSCMVYDVDDGTPFEMHALFSDYYYYAHTTASSTPETPKWRLVLPLKKAVPGKEWGRAWEAGRRLFKDRTGSDIDGACKDPSRMYYVAPPKDMCQVATSSRKAFTSYDEGVFLDLDWRSIEKPKPRNKVVSLTQRKAKTAKSSERKIMEALRSEPDSRKVAAERLGAQITGDGIARYIECPQCRKKDVWFCIDPSQKHTAQCNHRNSCGWYGSVYDLLKEI